MQNSVGQYQSPTGQQTPIVPENKSGVYIQIFNPSVGTPGGAPVYNVNAPSYGVNPYANANCYPANYYTQQYGQPALNATYNTYPGSTQTSWNDVTLQSPAHGAPAYINGQPQQGTYVNGQQGEQNPQGQFNNGQPQGANGQYINGQQPWANPQGYNVNGQNPQGPNGAYINKQYPQGMPNPQQYPQGQYVNGQWQPMPNPMPQQGLENNQPAGASASGTQQNTYNQQGQTVNGNQINGNQNITINNPAQPINGQGLDGSTNNANGANGQNNTTNTNATATTSSTENSDKKTEKRPIVMLTDDYIKNVESYLNSQDKEVRLMGAKEVAARAMEDPSRKDDKALNALVNKMIQDPDMKVRFLGLSLLYSRTITGDDFTVGVLQNMQNSTTGYGQDALMAANILLKMSGQTAEKEFEVTDKAKKKKTTEDINKVMTLL